MLLALLALVIVEGDPLPDGRREVIITLSAPWESFCEWDWDDGELLVEEPLPTVIGGGGANWERLIQAETTTPED